MLLTRLALVPLLLAGTLPCIAQSGAATQSPDQGKLWIPGPGLSTIVPLTPALSDKAQTASPKVEVSPILPCYSIRDYQFANRSGSGAPMLKRYSTCESASLFKMREVTLSPRTEPQR